MVSVMLPFACSFQILLLLLLACSSKLTGELGDGGSGGVLPRTLYLFGGGGVVSVVIGSVVVVAVSTVAVDDDAAPGTSRYCQWYGWYGWNSAVVVVDDDAVERGSV